MSTLDLPALEAVLAAMSPGPWETDLDVFDMAQEGVVACVHNRDNSLFFTIGMDLTLGESEWTREKANAQYDEARGRQEFTDAKGIVALRNAAPALIARVKALEDALGDALDGWADLNRIWRGDMLDEAADPDDVERVCRVRDSHITRLRAVLESRAAPREPTSITVPLLPHDEDADREAARALNARRERREPASTVRAATPCKHLRTETRGDLLCCLDCPAQCFMSWGDRPDGGSTVRAEGGELREALEWARDEAADAAFGHPHAGDAERRHRVLDALLQPAASTAALSVYCPQCGVEPEGRCCEVDADGVAAGFIDEPHFIRVTAANIYWNRGIPTEPVTETAEEERK